MSDIRTYFEQAELSLAAYSTLSPGMTSPAYIAALRDDGRGMSPTQAAAFAGRWRVVEQYDGRIEQTYVDEFGQEQTFLNPTGLSVTLFEEVGSLRQVVAIRGTQSSFPDWIADWATNIIDIGLLGTPEHQAQYAALSDRVGEWLDSGLLQPGFTATGHSLGGFLATGLAVEYANRVGEAYLYNAPGLGSVVRDESIAAQVWHALSPTGGSAAGLAVPISNIVATRDPVSEVGLSVAPSITIQIESGADPINNHSIVTLTDALALYDLIARLDPAIAARVPDGAGLVGEMLKAASPTSGRTLESTLDAIHRTLLPTAATPTPVDEREAFHANLKALNDALRTSPYNLGTADAPRYAFTITSLAGFSPAALEFAARENIAFRYALKEGNPFAILGYDYRNHNTEGLSEEWISDRARLLERMLTVNTADRQPGLNGYHRFDNAPDTLRLIDLKTGFKVEDVRTGGSMLDGTAYAIFGTESAGERIVGGAQADRIYGMNGDDGLDGGGGDETHRAMAFRNCVRGIAISNCGSMRHGCTGFASLNLLWVIPLLVILVLGSVVVFYEGRKAYWDYQVREMCAKDGGVTVNEVVILSPTEAESMPKSGGYIGVGPESLAGPHVPFFYRVKEVRFREWNPRVTREEKAIFRRSDGRVIATSVVYGRGGGDVPSFAFPSVFYCPDLIQEKKEIQSIFQIEGKTK